MASTSNVQTRVSIPVSIPALPEVTLQFPMRPFDALIPVAPRWPVPRTLGPLNGLLQGDSTDFHYPKKAQKPLSDKRGRDRGSTGLSGGKKRVLGLGSNSRRCARSAIESDLTILSNNSSASVLSGEVVVFILLLRYRGQNLPQNTALSIAGPKRE